MAYLGDGWIPDQGSRRPGHVWHDPGTRPSGVQVLDCCFEGCTREGVHAYVWNRSAVHADSFTECSGGVAVAAITDAEDDDARPSGWGDPAGFP
ncbi:hypothetical protein GCM10007079_07020 [Nocardiopsis terrae]|uniref:Uncharacterized protein n=1 Tax=Nocardiopsis terrae TaxID=372655 RepID=A0ABR9HNZ7_9ACTN|nr:hypothetical protein [Nocardiopsis terrae]MBE1460749.1 hypothetical protein [Nocardiopsis terrae]GHC73252.1 hypothetical protein GCM10007079_07020 [Nocardiopsis terrae]